MSDLDRRKDESLAGHADRLASMDLTGWNATQRAGHAQALARANALARVVKQKRKLARAARTRGSVGQPEAPSREPKCVVCGQGLEPAGLGSTLHSLTIPPGLVCRPCFAAGPAAAAATARSRAARERALAQTAEESSAGETWADVLEAVREYADFLDALADRLEGLEAWPKVIMEQHRRSRNQK